MRRDPWWWVLLAAGLLLRVWFFQHQMVPDDDTDVYAELARNLFHHGIYGLATDGVIGPTLIRLPGYPLFLSAIFSVFGWDNFSAVLMVQIAFDLLSCWLIASFVREQISARAGRVAMAIAALCPFTAAYSAMALTECLSIFAVSLGLWAAGRLLRAQAASGTDRAAVLWVSVAMGLAILLRPDGVLLAAAVMIAIAWYAARQGRLRVGLKSAALCGVLAVLPLVPWTIRNWHTFHVIQPLAPRRVNDPGEYVTYGFYRWMNTWSVDIVSTGAVYWNVGSDVIDIHNLPSRAFDSAAQREQTARLLDEYNAKKMVTPALDEKFGELAQERVRMHPVLCRIWVPVLRVTDMFLRPRTETLVLKPDWWRFDSSGVELIELVVLGMMNLLLVGAGVIGIVRGRVPWMVLPVAYLLLRCVLLSTMENSEPRYTLEAMPLLIACAACAFCTGRVVGEKVMAQTAAQARET
ncbi:MAG TPA: glycosyltransferase family 39 protein [Acidobacteriaceae bacterium]|nr:glycosyltransferase family 39 protein [Acidobacteriaceae bacterium]